MDSQYGVSLTVNGLPSFTVAIGPNIALDLQISPSRGAVLVNNYLVESQTKARMHTLSAVRNGVNKLAIINKIAKMRGRNAPGYSFLTNSMLGGNSLLGNNGYLSGVYSKFDKRSKLMRKVEEGKQKKKKKKKKKHRKCKYIVVIDIL